MVKVTAHCTRLDGWWAVEVPEVDGAFTQSRRLDQVAEQVADAVGLLEDLDPSEVEVEVVPIVDGDLADRIAYAKRLRREAEDARARAAEEIRAVARALHHHRRMPLRDVGTILDVSYQRAHQLAADPG